MARYRLNDVGVHDTQPPAHDIRPDDYTEWQAYLAWLAAGNVPDAKAAPPPQYPTLAMQRAEALARLDAIVSEKRKRFTLVALGHTFEITFPYLVAINLFRAVMPPVPPGFGLPDASRVLVPMGTAELGTLATAISARLIAINTNFVNLAATVNASATPLTVNLNTGWP